MNKVELAAALARYTGTTKVDAEVVVNATFKIIADTLATGDKVRIDDFGTFEVKNRAPRIFALVVSNVVCNFPVTCLAPKRLRHRRPTIAVP